MKVPTKEEILAALRVPPEVKVTVDRNGRPNYKTHREPKVIINRFQNLLCQEKLNGKTKKL